MRAIHAMPRAQRGATLLVGMVMLMLLTMLAVSAANTVNVQLRVIGNSQTRQEGIAATNVALQRTISSADFISKTSVVAGTPITVDINQDGVADFTVAIAPSRTSAVPFLNAKLDVDNAEDFKCYASQEVFEGQSMCAQTGWDLQARATDLNNLRSSVTIYQGVSVRVSLEDAKTGS